jgi:hypothetical protein
MKKSVVLQFKF